MRVNTKNLSNAESMNFYKGELSVEMGNAYNIKSRDSRPYSKYSRGDTAS